MKQNKKTYWKGLEQLSNDPQFVKYADKEFAEELPLPGEETGSSRRDFLKLMGFSLAAVSVAACDAPVRKAIPYLNKPEDIDPGVPNYYASSYAQGGNYCSILVKTREGRPIKIEGNDLSGITKGGTSAQVEASVLSLYADNRIRAPYSNGEESNWSIMDGEIKSALGSASSIRLVTNTIMSPSTKAVIEKFTAKYPSATLVTYDTQSAAGMIKANDESFGKAKIPTYDFSKAEVVVSFDADFLGNWISPIEYTKQYSTTRKVNSKNRKMSRHYHYESNMSVTGANADYRIPVKPSQMGPGVVALFNAIASKAGAASLSGGAETAHISKAADDLWNSRGKSLVVSGSNDPAVQVVVNGINDLLGNYGSTIDLKNHSNYRKGNDSDMNQFVTDMTAGNVDAVIFMDCNPVYNHPKGAAISAALSNVGLTVSTAGIHDETSENVKYLAPTDHFLESWGDAEPRPGVLSLIQPTITRIFNTRQTESSLLKWAGENADYFEFVKSRWQSAYYPNQTKFIDFQVFWDSSLHDGIYVDAIKVEQEAAAPAEFAANLSGAGASIASNYKSEDVELALYFNVGVGDGTEANNPWLQEMPDPITKATWDNYMTVSQAFANANGIKQFDGKTKMGTLSVAGQSIELPVLIQPGQADGTIGLALGYGRSIGGKVADNLGYNAYPLAISINGTTSYSVSQGVSITASETDYQLAQTQTHETYMGRETVIQETTLAEYVKNDSAGRYHPHVATWQEDTGETNPGTLSLWQGHKYPDHHWGLAIDLNSCTGCGTCTIACQVENNVPVVGRDEVINRREMHWMRIDRYYSSDGDPDDLKALEIAAANPEVTFQPMMCQHCNNAPCETVCPVAATSHSTEGLNQMAYNRCIGTRYCANNCPYKVRRFNWFKYHDNEQFSDSNTLMNSDLGKMVLNPDVTVRSRGVMEKCSMCVQRIQYGKLEAKKEKRKLTDADVNTACASSCPADAIVFGDISNPESKISKALQIKTSTNSIDKHIEEPRAYAVLEEIGVKPNVLYLTKVRNKDNA